MKTLFVLLSCVLSLCAQVSLTLTGPASAAPGSTVSLALTSAGGNPTGDFAPAGFEWKVAYPAGYTGTASAGAVTTAANKGLYCTSPTAVCFVVGMNTTVIGNGQVATIQVQIPSTAAAGSVSFPLSMLAAGTSSGAVVPISAGPAYSLIINAPVSILQDINGDGKVDINDVKAFLSEVDPGPCVHDLNKDGKCDLFDVFQIVLKGLGLI